MNEFPFKRVTGIVSAWVLRKQGLGQIFVARRLRPQEAGGNSLAGATGATTGSHCRCLSSRVNCVLELPAEGWKRSL